MTAKNNYLVISSLGKDRPGIIDAFSRIISELHCNIIDSRMTVLGGEFAMLLMIEGPWNHLAKLEDQIAEMQRTLHLTIISARTEARGEADNILPYVVEVVSLDHPGIVHQLARFFSLRNINIEDMNTTSYSAAHTGTQMFSVNISVGIPANIQIAELREEFIEFCDTMNLDAVIEPHKGRF